MRGAGRPFRRRQEHLLKALYANYLVQGGSIRIRHRDAWLDMAAALPHEIADVRRHTLGYVSQFLRAIPRVAALDIVAEPLCEWGMDADAARREAGAWLARLNIRNGCGRRRPLFPAASSSGSISRAA